MNPFAALQVSDDEEEFTTTPSSNQPKPAKKTHQQRKQAKQAKIKQSENVTKQSTQDDAPLAADRVKEDPRKKRYHEVIPPKEVPATGHYLDRRSGTGRADRPKKEGGGRGGVGNLHDELNKDKYVNEAEQLKEGEETEAKEPEKPEGITLDEYYRNKGIDFENTTGAKREPVKKGEINAEWIKKEKLTVLETKQDKKEKEGNVTKKNRREYTDKVGMAENLNSELFGFNAVQPKKTEQPREHRQPREPREQREHKPRQQREPREHKQPREPREQRQPREPRQQKGTRGPKDNRDNRDNRDNKGAQQGAQRGGQDNRKGGNKPQVALNLNDFPAL